jgi:hypothetical protein
MIPIDDDDSARRTVPIVTYALIVLNVLFFLVELSAGLGSDGRHELQIVGAKARVLCDARKHLGADFFAIVKRENKVRPALARQRPMGP